VRSPYNAGCIRFTIQPVIDVMQWARYFARMKRSTDVNRET
jgi:hypothetical protein